MKSPKCPECLERGRIAQMYRVAGTGFFKCHDCKVALSKTEFDPIDFNWDTDGENWKLMHNWKLPIKDGVKANERARPLG